MSLISVNNLSFRYDGSFTDVFENVSFNIDTDWKLGLIGRNGKGKTTLLKLLMGQYKYSGTISKNVEFDYFPFEVKNKERMAIEIVNEIAPNVEDWQVIKELNLLNTDAEILYRNFNLLSGGEQVKILLISLFLKGNNFLLIDEPTNHLDNETRENLVEYLKKKKGFIVVSHDRNFLDKVVDHIISINNTNIEIQKGNFSSWQENKDKHDNFELMQNEKLQKNINRLEVASRNTANWSMATEKSKYNTTNSGSSVDRGYIGHKSAKMMKKSKVMEKRIENAIQEKSCGCVIMENNKVLLIQHRIGHWGFPKGHVEAGETEKETAIREVKEETGLEVEIQGDKRYTMEYRTDKGNNKQVVFFLAEKVGGTIKPQEEEVSQIQWLEFTEALQKITYSNTKELLQKIWKENK